MFYVYVHRKLTDNSIFYVGKGLKTRAYQKSSRSAFWKNIVAKHGYSVEIVCHFELEQDAFAMEMGLIAWYGQDRLCNLTSGGEGLCNPSLSTREKIRKSIKRLSEYPETKLAYVTRMRKYYSKPEAIKLASDLAKKRMESEEVRNHLRQLALRQFDSIEKRSSHPQSVKVLCKDTGMVFGNMALAQEWLRANGFPKADKSAICNACKGSYRKAYGFHWDYA